jgi:hypothetical protein
MPATSRFNSLAKKFGMPYATTLWTDPKADPEFSKAIRQNRVVTVFSENVGSRKDYGKIGYHPGTNSSFLIFPKPLPKGDDAKIVGIQYDDLASEPLRGKAINPVKNAPSAAKAPSRLLAPPRLEIHREPAQPSKLPAPRAKPERKFMALLKRTAVWEQRLSVSAKNQKEAREKFQQAAQDALFDPTGAKVRTEIKTIRGTS